MNVLPLRLPPNNALTQRCHPWTGISGTQMLNREMEKYHGLKGNHSKRIVLPNKKNGSLNWGEEC